MEIESQSTSMQFLLLQDVQFLEVKDDALFQWELVDVLDSQEEHDDGDADKVPDGFGSWDSSISWSISSPNNAPIHYHPDAHVENRDTEHYDDDDDYDVDDESHNRQIKNDDEDDDDDDDDDVDVVSHGRQFDDDDEDEDDGYGLNDELVPWDVSNKLGRQRMRKLGKRVFSKMNNSKRSPYLFVRPGCVRGKHGLGLKHNY